MDRKTLLIALKKAHLLVVNKPTADDYSNYSFSSKILEYMASGTPVLTTKVGGMPEEYYEYFYFIEEENVDGIQSAIENYLNFSEKQLKDKGIAAKEFANSKKNYRYMTNNIIAFLSDNIYGET